jgi:hypothetical protein
MRDTRTSFLQTGELWFGMMGAPVIWSIHLLVIWFADEFGCGIGLGNSSVMGINVIHALVLLASLIAGIGIMASGVTSYRTWQQIETAPSQEQEQHARGVERGRFMALMGMGFSPLFLLVMVYMTIPAFLLPACS